MRIYYDLHIHSALSPCGDEDMTPNNIVNMSVLKGLDVIAVTDHNSCGNVRAVIEAAGGNILVIPGMEVETAEEIHVVCYFQDVDTAEKMWDIVKENMSGIKNRPEIFGRQLYMNSEDEVIGEEEELLVSATRLGIEDVFRIVKELGGVAVPAHIDRDSYSTVSTLGYIPAELNATAVEITTKNREQWSKQYEAYQVITNSDAHYLGDISEPNFSMDIMAKTPLKILEELTKKKEKKI